MRKSSVQETAAATWEPMPGLEKSLPVQFVTKTYSRVAAFLDRRTFELVDNMDFYCAHIEATPDCIN
jgi:hypothetical protein